MNLSISLTPELVGLIEAHVRSGRYGSSSEVVSEALRLLERADQVTAQQGEALKVAWREGAASDDAGILDFAALREAAMAELSAQKG